MSISAVAQRYVNAFFAYIRERGELEAVNEQLQQAVRKLSQEPDLIRILYHPEISVREKQTVIEQRFAAYGELVLRLFKYLVAERRIELLPEIAAGLDARVCQEKGIAEVELTTAIALDQPLLERLLMTLEKKLGKRVRAKTFVDPEIMGGLVIRHGDTVYDGSVRTMLRQINRRLGGGME